MLQLTENKQQRPALIENFEPSDRADKSASPPWRLQDVTPALRTSNYVPAELQCLQEAHTIYDANTFGGGTFDEARVPGSLSTPFTRVFRDDSEPARGRTQNRDGQVPQRQGDYRRISGGSGEAGTLFRGDRHPRMVGAERLGQGANAKNRRAGLCRAGGGSLPRQDRYDSGGSPRIDARIAARPRRARLAGRIRLPYRAQRREGTYSLRGLVHGRRVFFAIGYTSTALGCLRGELWSAAYRSQ